MSGEFEKEFRIYKATVRKKNQNFLPQIEFLSLSLSDPKVAFVNCTQPRIVLCLLYSV